MNRLRALLSESSRNPSSGRVRLSASCSTSSRSYIERPELFPVFEKHSDCSLRRVRWLKFRPRLRLENRRHPFSKGTLHTSCGSRLADHRFEVGLAPFSYAESSMALTSFEKALGEKIRPELRRKLIENSQGYPWLLKKLSSISTSK